MIGVNKTEFMKELEAHLSKTDARERAEALAFYNEYFDEAGIEKEQTVIQELGSPAQVAAQIKADAAVRDIQSEAPVRKGISAVWIVILGILALPVALPLTALLALIAFIFLIVAGALLFAAAVIVAAVLFSGVVVIAVGVDVFFAYPAVGIFYIGIGLLLSGLSLLAAGIAVVIAEAVIRGVVRLLNYIRVKIRERQAAKVSRSKGGNANE